MRFILVKIPCYYLGQHSYLVSLISLYSRMYSVISQFPSSSGAFQNNVIESFVISIGSGEPGIDGCSKKNLTFY